MRSCFKVAVPLLLSASVAAALFILSSDRPAELQSFAAISGEVRVIEAKVIGAKSAGEGLLERAYEMAWRGAAMTVPPGKKWVLVVTPTDQFVYSGDARERWRGFGLNLMGVFREGEAVYHGELPAGTYTNLDLYIYNTMQLFADTPANHAWAKVPVMYLVLEMDAQ